MKESTESVNGVRPVLWVIDPNNGRGERRDRLEKNATGAFIVKAADSCSDLDSAQIGEAIGIIGHNRDLRCGYLRGLPLKIVHYSGGNVSPPQGFVADREFRVRYSIAPGKDSRVPSEDDFIQFRDWLLGSGPRPGWIVPFKVAAGVGLQVLDILVVGFLAMIDRGVASSGVLMDTAKSIPRDARLAVPESSGQPASVTEWFEPAIAVIDAATAETENGYWEEICDKAATVRPSVEALRLFYSRLKEAPETVRREDLTEAHAAFKELWKGGYL